MSTLHPTLQEHLNNEIRKAKAEAWEEGAQYAWHESGEGWNGEYPGGPFDVTTNPYRDRLDVIV